MDLQITENPELNQPDWNEPFYKVRTNGKCLSVGISFIANRFLKILRLALPVIIFSSLCLTILTSFLCSAEYEMFLTDSFVGRCIAFIVLLFVTSSLTAFAYRCVDVSIEELNLYSIGNKYIYNHLFLKYFTSSLIINSVFILLAFLLLSLPKLMTQLMEKSDILMGEAPDAGVFLLVCKVAAVILLILITIPFPMVFNKMIFERNGVLHDMKSGYLYGWKKWGRIFALVLMVGSLVALLAVMLMAPAYVISLMQHAASESRLQGDSVSLPAYVPYLTMLITFISSFIISIIVITANLPFAYLYAATTTAEADKNTITKKS